MDREERRHRFAELPIEHEIMVAREALRHADAQLSVFDEMMDRLYCASDAGVPTAEQDRACAAMYDRFLELTHQKEEVEHD
jgi:hypothetical protein